MRTVPTLVIAAAVACSRTAAPVPASSEASFEALCEQGNAAYDAARYEDAAASFRQALQLSAPVEAAAAALRARRVAPSASFPPECRRSASYGLREIAAAAARLEPARALRCLEGALEPALAARPRLGNCLYLTGDADGALAEHRRVLQVAPESPESLFFVGALLLERSGGDKARLAEGKRYWQKLLEVAPNHPRAALVRSSMPRLEEIFSKGATQMPPGHPEVALQGAQSSLPEGHPSIQELPPGHPVLGAGQLPQGQPTPGGRFTAAAQSSKLTAEELRNVADAVADTPRTPELSAGLDELTAQGEALLDQGKPEEARDALVRVMPMRPGDARLAAALGAAMRQLGKEEMAERVLTRALQLDPAQPRALLELGKLYAARGNRDAALSKLRAAQRADAKFAAAHGVAGEIARLR